ncbi:hypothetical protein Aros01_03972 [Streptosporangium roseum]|uniref:Uncharacterized protein n=1 Tax=Streptosporangium roseum (strain ATCC 12428 / DSM 43021 / JCM 3005 / KCTC 9067 / NCIMB 10171 / NRRL 2505 / NI 9100) TaxID=479432 RepID=D2AS87_STRRD|nr:hypothetical protein Sros_3687 [Streptosporangium roseum DSM 43021]
MHRWNTFTVEGEQYRNALVSVSRSHWREFEHWCTTSAVENGTITAGTARQISAIALTSSL